MRIVRVATKQGHSVPATVSKPVGPFPPDLFRPTVVVTDYDSQPDGGGEQIPEDGTAQNGFRPVKWYRCRLCMDAVAENDLESHFCSEDDYDGSAA